MAKNITKVPNGPLIKKKGPYAGSGLKTGGVIKKAQAGVKLSPQQRRAQMDSIASDRRAEIVRKKDSILNRNATARGMTREEVRAQQEKDKNKPDALKSDLTDCTKRTDKKGSCTTGQTGGGQSTKDNKRNGGPVKKAKAGAMIKRADGSMSRRGLWDNLRSKAAQNKKTGAKPKSPTKAMLTQEKKIKAKGK